MTKVETLAKEIWKMIQTKFDGISKSEAVEVFEELSLNCENQIEHLQQEIDDEDPDDDEWDDDSDDDYDEEDNDEDLEDDD